MGDDGQTSTSSSTVPVREHSLRPPRFTIVFIAAWNLILVPTVVVTAVTESAWAVLPAFAISAALLVIGIFRARRRIRQHVTDHVAPGEEYVVLHKTLVTPDAPHVSRRWTGGGSIPMWIGRCEAPSPMVVLELRAGRVHMRFRPRLIALMFGVNPLSLSIGGLEGAYPVRRWFRSGVALKPVGSAPHYFWTSETESILAALEVWGFTVTREQRKAER